VFVEELGFLEISSTLSGESSCFLVTCDWAWKMNSYILSQTENASVLQCAIKLYCQ